MGKITINELHNSLFDYVQTVSDNKLETNNKTIVGAINELFSNNNNDIEISNGKQLIANAIGEPLTAEDSFNEMSNDINSLLSTFKTNMMNNGVTVESGDKFKQLIDKIATLADSEGRGIQYATGQGTPTSTRHFLDVIGGSLNLYYLQVNNLTFKPSIILLGYSDPTYGDYTTFYSEELASDRVTLVNTKRDNIILGTIDNVVKSSSCTINSTGFILPVSMARNYTWIAIGVGEEDTTLRDSLASILQDEGVEVTPEDDMADLIVKVDEEFDRKNANSGLDIISATELPATGKENQICIITNNPVDKFLVSSLDSDFSNLPNDTILLQTKHESTTHNYTVNNGNVISKYYISSCAQEDSIIPSYVYTSGQWVELTPGRLYFVKNKQVITTTEFGTIYKPSIPYVNTTGDGISFYSLNTTNGVAATVTNKINLSAFRRIHIVARVSSGGSSTKYIGVYSTSSKENKSLGSSSYPAGYVKVTQQRFTSTEYADGNVSYYRQEFDFDITDWTGEYYLGFYFQCNDSSELWMYIEEIYFY